ncbi:d7654c19-7073-4ed9-a2be-fd1299e158c5 [Thermothielavioides terrestris]|uniref:non-reducing end alpha-L-arabinofuranosidase n=1 Tax=Thermothielavioides terrestris TaxID=2587410 RepID=A0A446BFW3_9PEZI|nr:d7654c19-7073-4ed9-a2be-fd1299e158c5 [Thermothielavioides terrestris]
MAPLSLRALSLLGLAGAAAAAVTLSVAKSGGNATSPYMYGIMFEDISHSGDGGLYAELIQNRAFQNGTLDAWSAVGGATLALDTSTPLSQALPRSVKVTGGQHTAGLKNSGFWGFDVKKSKKYTGSFYSYGDYSGRFTVSLVSNTTNEIFATTTVKSKSVAGRWTQHTFELRPTKDAPDISNSFVLEYKPTPHTELKFNLISLFPPTYKNRANGMRPELMEKLKELNPTYIRCPGGNNVEGNYAGNYWNWSATVGPLKDRPGRPGTWGYYNTDGLGLVEYMHWAEDLGMDVVLAVPAGLYLDGEVVSEADLAPFVQDALNELEFLMGDVSTPYGAMRAKLGYPKPWKIKFVEIGNEDNLWGGLDSYKSYRFRMFYDAIKAKYPDIFIFSSTAEYMYKQSGRDYHEYTRPDYFVSQFGMFDNWTAGNPIMIGEFASIQNNTGKLEDTDWNAPKNPWSTWIGSVAEAVFLLGAERNSDRVWGVSFAPLLQNLNSYQWTPDLISFTADPADTTVSVSYPILSLFAKHPLTHTLPATAANGTSFGPAYWVAGRNDAKRTFLLKAAVYNSTGGAEVPFRVGFDGLSRGAPATLTVLTAPGGPFAHNTPANKNAVKTAVTQLRAGEGGVLEFSLPDLSVAVLEAKW